MKVGSSAGSSAPVPVDLEVGELAERAVRHASAHLSERLHYARVDLLQWEGAWVVSELELIEPDLFLRMAPGSAARFATAVVAALATVEAVKVTE